MALITELMLTGRLGPNVSVDVTQAEDLIDDVSALVYDAAEGNLDDVNSTNIESLHPELIPVVVSATRRALVNPDGFGSEMLDGYRFEQAPRDGVFLSPAELAKVRKAAGLSGTFTSVALVSPWSGDL